MKTIEYTPTVFKAILNQDEYKKFINNDGIYWDIDNCVMVEKDLDLIDTFDDRVRNNIADLSASFDDLLDELADEDKYLNCETFFRNSDNVLLTYNEIAYPCFFDEVIYAIGNEGPYVYSVYISNNGDEKLYEYAEREADKILEWSRDID